jgi:hypothetical protein
MDLIQEHFEPCGENDRYCSLHKEEIIALWEVKDKEVSKISGVKFLCGECYRRYIPRRGDK